MGLVWDFGMTTDDSQSTKLSNLADRLAAAGSTGHTQAAEQGSCLHNPPSNLDDLEAQ